MTTLGIVLIVLLSLVLLALAALVAAPVKPHGPGSIGRRRGPELTGDGFAFDFRIVGVHVAHAHEHRLAGGHVGHYY